MIVTVKEMKNYLRVDFDDDDVLLSDHDRAVPVPRYAIARSHHRDLLPAAEYGWRI